MSALSGKADTVKSHSMGNHIAWEITYQSFGNDPRQSFNDLNIRLLALEVERARG